MTVMWKFRADKPQPIPVEAEVPEYPHRDAEGEQIFINTHFLKREDAFDALQRDVEAGVRMAGIRVSTKRQQLLEAEHYAASCAAEYAAVCQKRAHERMSKKENA